MPYLPTTLLILCSLHMLHQIQLWQFSFTTDQLSKTEVIVYQISFPLALLASGICSYYYNQRILGLFYVYMVFYLFFQIMSLVFYDQPKVKVYFWILGATYSYVQMTVFELSVCIYFAKEQLLFKQRRIFLLLLTNLKLAFTVFLFFFGEILFVNLPTDNSAIQILIWIQIVFIILCCLLGIPTFRKQKKELMKINK